MLPEAAEAADMMAGAAEGAYVGSATPEGQCLGNVNDLLGFVLEVSILPVVIVRLAYAAGGGRDSVDGSRRSGGCSSGFSNTSRAVP